MRIKLCLGVRNLTVSIMRSNRATIKQGKESASSEAQNNQAVIVGIGGLLTVKQVAQWYNPVLAIDKTSDLPTRKRFIAPFKRGLGEIEEMREDLTMRLEKIHDREEGRKLLLVGHSLGALMSTMAAVARPEVVAGVIALGGVHDGIERETWGTRALKAALGNPPQSELLWSDSDFMNEHRENVRANWPADAPLHVISTPTDYLIPPPRGFGIELSGERTSQDNLLVPPLLGGVVCRRMGIGPDVARIPTAFPVEHVNLPICPAVVNYVREAWLGMNEISDPARPRIPVFDAAAAPAAA